MKLSTAVLLAVASAEDKKVPPRHPLQRLARLTELSDRFMNQWFSCLPSKDTWVRKFQNNARRMEYNFKRGNQRCGFVDASVPNGGPALERKRRFAEDELERLSSEPSRAIKQLTTRLP